MIKSLLKKIIPEPAWNFFRAPYWRLLSRVRDMRAKIKDREVLKRFGDKNPGIKFYVIKPQHPDVGLLSNYRNVLKHIKIAEHRKLVPVVDMEYYATSYQEDKPVNGTENAWEYYFRQSCEYSLEEVYQSRNVILSKPGLKMPAATGLPDFHSVASIYRHNLCSDDEILKKLYESVEKYMRLNEITENYIAEKSQGLLLEDKKILGVASRGTDYTSLRPSNHPVQPSLEELISLAKEKVSEWDIDYIYLTTEENETLEKFKQAFPGRVLAMERMRHTGFDPALDKAQTYFERENAKYLSGLEYLAEIIILSRCNYFLGALNNGAAIAIIMNGAKYEGKHIIELGIYP